MRKFIVFLFVIAGICLVSCTEPDFLSGSCGGNDSPKNDLSIITETVPFDVEFTGEYTFPGTDETTYGPLHKGRVIVNFEGTGTLLGNLCGNFDFCFADGGYYGPAPCCMIADNGDMLYLSVEGKVNSGRLDDHPEHVIQYWRDKFIILGGTGKFGGATGEGYTDDYNSNRDLNSHHHWSGSITLIKKITPPN